MTKEDLINKRYLFIDLDGTLIKTASGKTFAEDVTDFRIRKDVLDRIVKLIYPWRIFIVTNQGGIPKFISEHDFEIKLSLITVFVERYTRIRTNSEYCKSLDPNCPMRKPNTGMLQHLSLIEGDGFSKAKSIMIGDASGKEGQFSDSDKKTAENYGIDYLDVDDFLNMKID